MLLFAGVVGRDEREGQVEDVAVDEVLFALVEHAEQLVGVEAVHFFCYLGVGLDDADESFDRGVHELDVVGHGD